MLHIKEIKPLFTNILTTADMFAEDETVGAIITGKEKLKGEIKDYQTVIAVGPMVRDIHVGDKVMINFKNYAVKKYDPNSVKEDMGMNSTIGYSIPIVDMDDENGNPVKRLFLNDRDIVFVFEGEEIEENQLEEMKTKLIMPKDKKILFN